MGASTADSYLWTGSLKDLGRAPIPEESDAPGTLVIGEVVSLAASLRQFDTFPAVASGQGTSERSLSWSR